MADELRGRVAIVTGGGHGLGRCHCMAFARSGVSVVVNDLDDSAEAVAAEIREAGGTAVASTQSCTTFEGAERLVRAAVDTFGDLNILVNNAGVLRDRMIFTMDEP